MFWTFWSVKGGSGATVAAAAVALALASRARAVLLVDIAGDLPATLGVAEPNGPGLRDWLAATDSPSGSLERLVVPVDEQVSLLHRGTATRWPPGRSADLRAALASRGTPVVVDAGTWPEGLADDCAEVGTPTDERLELGLASELALGGSSLLVTRGCYLALRRATAAQIRPDGVVLVAEPGRALDGHSITQVLGSPVLASLQVDPAVARAVDAGVLVRRPPRTLLRSIGSLEPASSASTSS